MRRITTSYRVALERLADHLDVTLVPANDVGRGFITLDLRDRLSSANREDEWLAGGFIWTGSRKLILAHLVMHAVGPPTVGWDMEESAVADVMRLIMITDRGLKAHEYQSIRRVLVS